MADQKNKKEKKLTVFDAFISVFYIIIIAIGINMCFSHGKDTSPMQLFAVTISVIAVLAFKLAKYKNELKSHRGEIIFVAALAVLGIFAIVTTIIL